MSYIITYYTIVNILLFLLMGIDKYRAISHKWRIKEATLLLFSLIGGGFGGFFGMFIFRHKITKIKFRIILPMSIIIHLALLYYIIAQGVNF